ncbi:Dehydrogenase/reductase SDR family member 4 [Aphelenchoides fujianensis]|nr:Dehydrogenase/reductase SDR family member 4 [Aphelenchoides fujianensis]
MSFKYKARRLDGRVAVITAATDGRKNVEAAIKRLIESGLKAENVVGIECHVGVGEQRARLLEFAMEKFHSLDILVNNAGISPVVGPLTEIDEQTWTKLFDVNVKAAFFLTQAALKYMKLSGSGNVIFNASYTAYDPPEGIALYGVTKTTLLAMTKAYAQSLAPLNIRVFHNSRTSSLLLFEVNAIAPGVIKTKMSEAMRDEKHELNKQIAPTRIDMQRFGSAQEVAATVAYLVSDDASYVTGETVMVTGGMHSRL